MKIIAIAAVTAGGKTTIVNEIKKCSHSYDVTIGKSGCTFFIET